MNWMIKIMKIFAVAVIIVVLASLVYELLFSMDKAREFEVNTPAQSQHLLIATQGSTFKDAVLTGLIAYFKTQDVYIKVIDVHHLDQIEPQDWQAICLIHTWENQKPPKVVQTFVDKAQDHRRLVTLTTSTFGGFKMEEVDGISGASKMHAVDQVTSELIGLIKRRMKSSKVSMQTY